MPQNIGGGLPLPILDMNTVYELNGNIRATDNLVNGSARLFSYPNARSVIGSYFNFVNNALLSIGMSTLRVIANGNTVMLDHSATSKLFEQRLWMEEDGINGTFWFLHRDKPIETVLFGNVQAELTPNVALTSPYVEYMYESFYSKGSPLPGIGQAQ